ncbi:MAG: TonB-dependent receptor [Gammaproteobacteria bacterium]
MKFPTVSHCFLALVLLSQGSSNAQTVASDIDTTEPRVVLKVAAPEIEAPQFEATQVIEEIIVTGRSRSSLEKLVDERLQDEAVVDILGAEAIGRLGDSTVSAALIRVPGISLVNNKFVYIRGLGERYSSSFLNGANIPSPDLTRNVIPLDIFPTSIVESLRIQKAYSADQSANFGGGSVDVRTKGIPDGPVFQFELGSGLNTENDGSALSYAGSSSDDFGVDDGSRALSQNLLNQIQRFQGNVDVQSILTTLRREGNTSATVLDAQAVNRELALSLNRQIGIEEKDIHPDISLKANAGNNFLLDENWEAGILVGGSYDTQWRNTEAVSRNFNFPDERIATERESTRSINISGTLNTGLRFGDDHEITTTSLFIRNTDDETAINDFFNENREVSDGIGFRNYRFLFEERELITNQITGTHILGGQTRDMLPSFIHSLAKRVPDQTEYTWFYSDAKAVTSIPNEVSIDAQTSTDPLTGQVLSSTVGLDATAADYRFTDLEDDVLNYGWSFMLPFMFDNSTLDIKFGYEHSQKARIYRQSQFSLGALSVADPGNLNGPLDQVFSDANILNTNNDFVFDIQGTNNQSYIAATMVDAIYSTFDWNIGDTWRIAAGARWEDYRQVALDWNPFGFTQDNPVLTTDPDVLQNGVFQDDKVYPALALTYVGDLWAETFQVRLGFSQTTVRPDLREITDASYIDPITDDLVDGNPGVVPSDVNNIDLRFEWFFGNGDNLTATLFHKSIDNPIEFFESAASDTTTAREIVNADSADIVGIELEALKDLGFLGEKFNPFFIRGNVTLQDNELVAGEEADAPTNPVRSLAGASDYVVNMSLGFDSPNGNHSASIGYNVFGERLYVAGRNGAPDGFEQPFHSLDMAYSWYPNDQITVQAKARNILDEKIAIERVGVTTFSERVGTSFALSFQWAM